MMLEFVGTRQAKAYISQVIKAGLVPFVQSSPGCGKSQIVAGIAAEQKLVLIDHRLSTSDITDLNGLPRFISRERDIATFVPFDIFPVQGTPLPPDKAGWLLFLDEFNSASEEVQAAAYKLVLDRMVGQMPLDRRVSIVCAGNLDTDHAITRDLSTAMTSRLVHIRMKPVFDEWMQEVALPRKFDARLVAYLQMNQDDLLNFNPEKMDAEETFSCPRTLEFLNRLLQSGMEVNNKNVPLMTGVVGQAVAVKFNKFCKCMDKLVTYEMIMKDPDGCPVPEDTALRWLCVTSVMNRVTKENFEPIDRYIQRFKDISFETLFLRNLHIMYQELTMLPAYVKRIPAVSGSLFG